MRGHIRCYLLAVYATLAAVYCPAYAFGQASGDDITSRPVSLRLTDASFVYVLGKLSVEQRIPIGLEVTADLEDETKLNIDVTDEPLKNVLDLITRRKPAYRWEVRDGVINFIPTKTHDPFVSQLLGTRVSRFAPAKGVNKYRLRDAIADLPEVKGLLDAHGMKVWRLGPPTYRSIYTDDSVDLSTSDTDVRGVLNNIVKASEHKLWVVSVDEHTRHLVHINF